ncbi:hypothetical protein Tco_1465563 [Tanacetum coccineum]
MDVHVHHEVPSQQTLTLLTVPILVITDSSPVYSTFIPQSLPSFTPPPQQSKSTPPLTTEATNPPSTIPYFAFFFQFNNRVSDLEKDVSELKKEDPPKLKFCQRKYLTLPPPSVIQKMVKELLEDVVLAKESSQPQSSYMAAATLTNFKLKNILIDKMDKNKDKDEDPSAGSDRGLKKTKTNKDSEPTKGPEAKESQYGSSKGTKSQPKSSRKSVQSKELEF